MNGEHAGAQCGLPSLLPMSCRGRAAAFARDLHTRLRSLGAQDDEGTWLAAQPRTSANNPREHDTFYDFELECESPSSPVDEFDAPFSDRSPTDEDPPFYDFDSETDLKETTKIKLQQTDKTKTNGFKFATSFYTETSPVKSQPSPRENGHENDKHLYSPITFEGCARHNSLDEIDCLTRPTPQDTEHLSLPIPSSSTFDSDSEFESAKSDPSEAEGIDESFEIEKRQDVSEVLDNLSITETELPVEEEMPVETCTEREKTPELRPTDTSSVEKITTEVEVKTDEKELTPLVEVDESLLCAEESETKTENNEDEDDDRPQRLRRCSSLKTGKTPPGTPGRKKIVRFADVLGLDLADVKTFMDEIPVIPKSAYDDLTGCDVQNSPPVRAPPRFGALTLVPLFQVPRDITEKLEKQNVCLESARVGDGIHINVCGSVRVRNLDFHKTVHIRYTMNRWKTYTDLQTTYVPGSCDGFSDRFQFVLYAPCITSGQRLEIAVRFQCKGQQFWDNNSGANYCFDCLALGATCTSLSSGPLHPILDWHPSFY